MDVRGSNSSDSTQLLFIMRVFLQFLYYPHNHPLQIIYHLIVPETQNPIPFGFQKHRTCCIILFLLHVLTTIQLNNELMGWRTEIGNVRTNGMLTPKFDAIDLFAANGLPKRVLGFGLILA